jgi:hypothetical protein
MNMFLDHVASKYNFDFVFFLVNAGIPEHFTLPDLKPPCVVYDMTHTALTAVSINVALSEDVERGYFRKLFLRLVSDFLIPLGKPELSFVLLDLAMQGRIHPSYEFNSIELEMGDYDEIYITNWFFGLAHELGHLLQAKQLLDASRYPFLSLESVARVYNELRRRADRVQSSQWVLSESGLPVPLSRPNYSLSDVDVKLLMQESLADITAADMLLTFCEPFAEVAGRNPNWWQLYERILAIFSMIRFVASAKFTASFLADTTGLGIVALPSGHSRWGRAFLLLQLSSRKRQAVVSLH